MSSFYVITGPSGAGKSTIIQELKQMKVEDVKFYDFDTLNRPYDETDGWERETLQKMMQIVQQNKKQNLSTVVGGLIRPHNLQNVLKNQRTSEIINYCLLLPPVTIRQQRIIQTRDNYDDYINYTELDEKLEHWVIETKNPYIKIDTAEFSVEQTCAKIASWIQNI